MILQYCYSALSNYSVVIIVVGGGDGGSGDGSGGGVSSLQRFVLCLLQTKGQLDRAAFSALTTVKIKNKNGKNTNGNAKLFTLKIFLYKR